MALPFKPNHEFRFTCLTPMLESGVDFALLELSFMCV